MHNFPEKYKGYIASTEEGGVDGANWYKGTNALSAFSNAVSSQYTNMGGTILSGIVDGVFTESLGTRTKYVGFLILVLLLLCKVKMMIHKHL